MDKMALVLPFTRHGFFSYGGCRASYILNPGSTMVVKVVSGVVHDMTLAVVSGRSP